MKPQRLNLPMRYKIPAKLAALSPARIRSLIRSGKADILPFRDDQGRAVIVMTSGVNFDDME